MGYSVRKDSDDIYGEENILKWADMDNDRDRIAITARIDRMIQEAYDQINSRLKNCQYVVPFVQVSGAYDPVIVTLSARLVGVLLYDNRKLVDTEEVDTVLNHRFMVERAFKQIHGGQIKLLTYESKAVAYPKPISTL